tara:strand:- start:2777 stop:3979 length:1203 start_codon:yes stop_codon:yes gene_type:complete
MSKYNLEDIYEGMSEKEYDAAKEAERLEAHPEKDKIKAIQALMSKEKKSKAVKTGEKLGFDMRGIKEDNDVADRIEGLTNRELKRKFLFAFEDLWLDLIEEDPFYAEDVIAHLSNEMHKHLSSFQNTGDKFAGVDEGTCGYDRDAKTGKKLKGPGGLGKVDEEKMSTHQHIPSDRIIQIIKMMNPEAKEEFLKKIAKMDESTGPSDKAETEDDVVNVDKVASPSAKGVGYGAETSANTAEDDQEDKEIQNPPPMYEDMSLVNLAKKLGIDLDDLKGRIKKMKSTEKDKIEADAFSKSAVAENGDVDDFTDELKEDHDDYKLRKHVVNLVMKEKSVPISVAQEFFNTHMDDIINNASHDSDPHPRFMDDDEILDEFEEFASVNYDSIDEDEKLKEHFKRFM